MSRLLAIAALVGLLPARALAWGTEGHQIVATIAQAHLTPAASRPSSSSFTPWPTFTSRFTARTTATN